jgi:hypothetical protein
MTQIGIPGSAFFQHDTFTVQGAGTDIWGTADSYRFVNATMVGDGVITARVTSEDAANTYAKAAVLTVYGNQTVILDVRPNGLIEFMARPIQGGTMQFIAGAAASFPVWLRIQRVGNQFSGYLSSDGADWQFIGSATVQMSVDIAAGLAVTSHDPTALNTSTFDHVRLSSAPSSDLDIGDTGAVGSALVDGGTFTVNGTGADIWGSRDAFNFFENLTGDGQMQVRITHLDNTDVFAKAGIMIRASAHPSSAHVIVDVRPDCYVECMQRASTGAETRFLAGMHVSFPVTLQLWRVGSSFNAAYSQDGISNWTHIGNTDLALPASALIGLAVTSHQYGVLASATFDSLAR